MKPSPRAALPGIALLLALAGCGVQPSGVIQAGQPATGLTKGLRLYFVSGSGRLEGVSRPHAEITELKAAVKLLAEGPTEAEQQRGLTSLATGFSYDVTAKGARVTVRSPDATFAGSRRDDLVNGQLVCTLARAQSLIDPSVRPDDVQVTLAGNAKPLGPYRCSQFLTP
ncbi:hypothetical protein ACFC0D_00930 [Streptomyces sp. NPDC056222]|uniref:hypothetical protein n=1 Tax=Streptomyces sp. NPDC056222 TaxID=3345749 RepID=UPI0035E0E738